MATNAQPVQLSGSPLEVLLRVTLGFVLAVSVTAMLLFGMQRLLSGSAAYSSAENERLYLDFVRVKREETLETRRQKPPPPQAPEPPPLRPAAPTLSDPVVRAEKINMPKVTVKTAINMQHGGFSLGMGETDYVPVVKVAPIYPRRALSRGIEGHCTVRFTINPDGTVGDVQVDEDDCTSSLFKRSAVEAAQKFKYRPRVVNGKPVEVAGVRNRFVFQIQK